jgi:exopolyphosphatase/guanosine-5'-triphosphate,3'-diphosphate pyrophosphatase
MSQTAYAVGVILLGVANVLLAGVAYRQRARQLASGSLMRSQHALAQERNQLAAQRSARLDEQVQLLTAIRDSIGGSRPAPRGVGVRPCRVGVIDVGSSTVRLVVVQSRADGKGLKKIGGDRAFLQLGAEVQRTGRYSAVTIKRVADRVAALEHLAATLGCTRLAIVLTAPGRLGDNPGALVAAIQRSTTTPVTALTATDEARMAFAGAAAQSAALDRRLIVCDVGGASTELAAGRLRDGVDQTCCLDMGALSLTEAHFTAGLSPAEQLESARAAIDRCLDRQAMPTGDLLIATGGSAHALARMTRNILDAEHLQDALQLATHPPKRVAKRLHPQRRRCLPAGVLLLSQIQQRLDLPLNVSSAGLREGVIHHLLTENWDTSAPCAPLVDREAV